MVMGEEESCPPEAGDRVKGTEMDRQAQQYNGF